MSNSSFRSTFRITRRAGAPELAPRYARGGSPPSPDDVTEQRTLANIIDTTIYPERSTAFT
mgnify:FL=1